MRHDATLSDDLHRAAIARFLQADVAPERREDHGFQGVLRALFPVKTADEVASLEFVDYQLLAPRCDADACLRRAMTLAAMVKVTVRLVIWEGPREGPREIRDLKEQEVYFGEVPLLSERGTLIVDGVERAPLLRLCRAAGAGEASGYQLRAAGRLFEEHARLGVAAMVEEARARMARAQQRDRVATLMPHDLLNLRPLMRAWSAMLKKSPYFAGFDAERPLARVALAGRVRVDADAREALDAGPFAQWLRRDAADPAFATLAVDAPVNEHGVIACSDAEGDRRTLAARLAPGGEASTREVERTLRALTLSSPEAPLVRGALDRAVAERSGALVVALRAGRVSVANDRRVWVVEDGSAAPTMYALQARGAPGLATPFSLRRVVEAGARVEAGDTLAEGAAVAQGTLALGRTCSVAPAAGLGAGRCRVSSPMREAFRSARIERVEVVTRDTPMGKQRLTREVPLAEAHALRHLDASGVVALGAEVAPGDVLAGVVTPVECVATAPGVWEERMADSAVRATVRGRVVRVDMRSRNIFERGERHASIRDAMERDLDAEAAELASCLAAARGTTIDACVDEAREAHYDRRVSLARGDDMPPGVLERVVIELLVERDLACGDVLANLRGECWTVDAIVDDETIAADVELPEAAGEGQMYLLRLAAQDPPAPVKKRRRASAASSSG